MMYKILRLIFLSVLIFSLTPSAFAVTPSQSINDFAFNAARIILSDGENFFFSPYSIISAFGMAYAGARGDTAEEFERVLEFDPEFNTTLGDLIRDIDKNPTLSSANKVWLSSGMNLKAEYTKILTDNYDSTAEELDFKSDTDRARRVINNWVSDRTNGRIRNLLSKLEPDTRMILTNAVYFMAGWRKTFNPEATSTKNFYAPDNKRVKVQMMMQVDRFDYGEFDGTKVIRLPYEQSRMSMIVILPPKDKGLDVNLDAAKFREYCKNLRRYEVDLWLPKFRTEKTYELKDLFTMMGLRLSFSNNADFSGITTDEPLKIDAVVHKTFIDVNEKQTEAAASTAITMLRATAAMPREYPKAEFHADRPFSYFVLDDDTETILFMGYQSFK